MLGICTVILMLANIGRKLLFFKFKSYHISKNDKKELWGFLRILHLILQSILILMHPNLFLFDREFHVENDLIGSSIYYQANDIFHFIQLYKLYICFRGLISMTFYSTTRSYRIW